MIETEGLTRQLGGRTVVSDVTFRCEPGTVTGFLGPNGAGKTTTMRMLVGLSEPDRGEARIFGGRYRDLPNPGRRGGFLLDASAQPAGRRGREALAVSAQTMGVPARRVDELLECRALATRPSSPASSTAAVGGGTGSNPTSKLSATQSNSNPL